MTIAVVTRSPSDTHRAWLAAQDTGAACRAWHAALTGVSTGTVVATAPATPSRSQVHSATSEASTSLRAALTRCSRAAVVSPNVIVRVAWAVLVSQLARSDDVVIGTIVDANPGARTGSERADELFVNMVPIRVQLRHGDRVCDVLAGLQAVHTMLMPHQHLPLSDIERVCGIAPLFDTVAVFDDYRGDQVVRDSVSGGLRLHGSDGWTTLRFPLVLVVTFGERLRLRLDSASPLFSGAIVEDMLKRFVRILEAIALNSAQRIDDVVSVADEERRTLLTDWSTSPRAVPTAPLPVLIEGQIERTPDAEAVIDARQPLTYADLNDRANRLAHTLCAAGAGPDTVVGIALPRTTESIVAVLAVLKSGAAYLPLDDTYPQARLRVMLDRVRPLTVVTTQLLASRLPPGTPLLVLDAPATVQALMRSASHNPTDRDRPMPLRMDHPAYVIYTSGSSGAPKAVVITHAGIPSLAAGQVERFAVTAGSRVLQFASLSFDASLSEIAMALTTGAALVMVDADQRVGDALAAHLQRYAVTHATFPPTVLQTLSPDALPSLRCLVVAGEPCPAEVIARWSQCRLINAYGPTEITVCATMSDPLAPGETPPIGRPSANTVVYVLDHRLRPAPVGVTGELYVAGRGLARGYLGDRRLTAERFVPDLNGDGARMYRTGDLVRWRADGTLDFVGRADDQVKIRGHRVELAEVQVAVASCPFVSDAVVMAEEIGSGERQLEAFAVLRDGRAQVEATADIREHLNGCLPVFMIPDVIVIADRIPRGVNGKIDRQALRALRVDRGASARTVGLPGDSPLEVELTAIWREVLHRDDVDGDHNFFDLGGHSMRLVRMASLIKQRLGVSVGMTTLFACPTIRALSAHLAAVAPSAQQTSEWRDDR